MAKILYSEEGQVNKPNLLGNRGVKLGSFGRVRDACPSCYSNNFYSSFGGRFYGL